MKPKIIVVTGASSGVGKALSLSFAKKDYILCAIARNYEKLKELREESQETIEIFPCDVSSIETVKKTFSEIYEKFNTIDVLINNASMFQSKPFVDQEIEVIDRLIDTNLKGTMYCTRLTIPNMIKEKKGKIINIASVAGTWGMPGQAIYCSSKHGVVGFGDALAQELTEHGILLTTVCPGGIDTPLWRNHENKYPGDIEKLMKPKEIVDLVWYILDRPNNTLFKKIILFPTNEWHAG